MPSPADCTHPNDFIVDRDGQFTRPDEHRLRYECRRCGAQREALGDFKIVTQLEWLQEWMRTAQRHGLKVLGLEHEEFIPTSAPDFMDELQACDEVTLWVQLEGGRRCPVQIIWQGPNDTYEQADEIIADYAGPEILDEVWQETKDNMTPLMRVRNPRWAGA